MLSDQPKKLSDMSPGRIPKNNVSEDDVGCLDNSGNLSNDRKSIVYSSSPTRKFFLNDALIDNSLGAAPVTDGPSVTKKPSYSSSHEYAMYDDEYDSDDTFISSYNYFELSESFIRHMVSNIAYQSSKQRASSEHSTPKRKDYSRSLGRNKPEDYANVLPMTHVVSNSHHSSSNLTSIQINIAPATPLSEAYSPPTATIPSTASSQSITRNNANYILQNGSVVKNQRKVVKNNALNYFYYGGNNCREFGNADLNHSGFRTYTEDAKSTLVPEKVDDIKCESLLPHQEPRSDIYRPDCHSPSPDHTARPLIIPNQHGSRPYYTPELKSKRTAKPRPFSTPQHQASKTLPIAPVQQQQSHRPVINILDELIDSSLSPPKAEGKIRNSSVETCKQTLKRVLSPKVKMKKSKNIDVVTSGQEVMRPSDSFLRKVHTSPLLKVDNYDKCGSSASQHGPKPFFTPKPCRKKLNHDALPMSPKPFLTPDHKPKKNSFASGSSTKNNKIDLTIPKRIVRKLSGHNRENLDKDSVKTIGSSPSPTPYYKTLEHYAKTERVDLQIRRNRIKSSPAMVRDRVDSTSAPRRSISGLCCTSEDDESDSVFHNASTASKRPLSLDNGKTTKYCSTVGVGMFRTSHSRSNDNGSFKMGNNRSAVPMKQLFSLKDKNTQRNSKMTPVASMDLAYAPQPVLPTASCPSVCPIAFPYATSTTRFIFPSTTTTTFTSTTTTKTTRARLPWRFTLCPGKLTSCVHLPFIYRIVYLHCLS